MQCLQLTVFKNSLGYHNVYEYLKQLKQSIRCSIFLFSHEFKTGSKGGNKIEGKCYKKDCPISFSLEEEHMLGPRELCFYTNLSFILSN